MNTRILQGVKVIACAVGAIVLTPPAQAVLVYAITEQNLLVSWDSAAPGTILSGTPMAISGGGEVETLQGIDSRPATGGLVGLGVSGRPYSISPTGGPVGQGLATVLPFPFGITLSGSNVGFDFNPTIDQIRVVTNTDQNFRIGGAGGLAGIDTNLAYASGDPNFGTNPNVTHEAYTNNFQGATTTTLYGIDTALDVLVIQGGVNGTPSADLGQLTTVGSLGINVAGDGGFDIVTVSGSDIAYAALRPVGSSVSNFYSINLDTGAATLIGEIGEGINIRAMALVIPGPGALASLLLGEIFAGRRRRE
jgi:hypothetical protein